MVNHALWCIKSYVANTLLTRKLSKSIFLTTDLREEGKLRDDFYAVQRALVECNTIWDSLSRESFWKQRPDRPPTYCKSVVRTMIFACIYECTILLIYLFADHYKNHLPYIPIPRKSVVRTMFPIYPDGHMKLSFQVLLKAIFLTSILQ